MRNTYKCVRLSVTVNQANFLWVVFFEGMFIRRFILGYPLPVLQNRNLAFARNHMFPYFSSSNNFHACSHKIEVLLGIVLQCHKKDTQKTFQFFFALPFCRRIFLTIEKKSTFFCGQLKFSSLIPVSKIEGILCFIFFLPVFLPSFLSRM